jgi:hypothetical protein
VGDWPAAETGGLMKTAIDNQQTVHQVLDNKGPLRGKGGMLAQWHAQTTARLTRLERDMAALAAESRTIAGRQWSLNHCSLRGGQQLRWRLTSGQHATWADIAPLLANLPPGLASWYAEAEDLAQWLNHRGQAIRYEIKTIERLTHKTQQDSGGPGARHPERPRCKLTLEPADQKGNAQLRSSHHAHQG